MDQNHTSASETVRINRRPADNRINLVFASLAMILLTGAGGIYLANQRGAQEDERRLAELNREYATESQKLERSTSLRVAQRNVERRGALAASLIQKTIPSLIVARLTNSLPDGSSLLQLTVDSPAEFNDAQPATHITLQAVATNDASAAQFIETLKQAPLFKQTRLLASKPCDQAGGTGCRMQVELTLNDPAGGNDRQREASNAAVAMR